MIEIDPLTLLRPRRRILGISAILLPFLDSADIDWSSLEAQIRRTCDAGLVPAVNMDTGYGNYLDEATKTKILNLAKSVTVGQRFAAGAFVADWPGAAFDPAGYLRQIDRIVRAGGIPVICQSFGLTSLADADLIAAYQNLARACDRFIAFELGNMFAPFGRIYNLEVYRQLLGIGNCIGAKHSSLDRRLEWQRLALRDQVRPEFHVFTGNDLAIDMVMYGSDYLLGLSTFAPDLFARRDEYWRCGDPAFFELNDRLQYLGAFAFREPVPAYKHSAAQFLKLRGWIKTSLPHPSCPRRPESDVEVFGAIARQLSIL
jgi:dihydrodipicolinate synthase/N-acetylneuraminate lyase